MQTPNTLMLNAELTEEKKHRMGTILWLPSAQDWHSNLESFKAFTSFTSHAVSEHFSLSREGSKKRKLPWEKRRHVYWAMCKVKDNANSLLVFLDDF